MEPFRYATLKSSISVPGSDPRNVLVRTHNPQTIMIEWDEPKIQKGAIQVCNCGHRFSSEAGLQKTNFLPVQTNF